MQKFYNLLTDAVDGSAIHYWANIKNVERNEHGDVTSFLCSEVLRDINFKWVKVTPKKIQKAVLDILTKDIDVSRELASQFIGEEWDTDINGVDIMIQYIVFKYIKYG